MQSLQDLAHAASMFSAVCLRWALQHMHTAGTLWFPCECVILPRLAATQLQAFTSCLCALLFSGTLCVGRCLMVCSRAPSVPSCQYCDL